MELEHALSYLRDTEQGKNIEAGINQLMKAQNAILKLMKSEDEESTDRLRIGTVLTIEVLRRIADGKAPKEFDDKDWKEILDKVIDGAVLVDGKDYSIFVFDLYYQYIEFSKECLRPLASEDQIVAIETLLESLDNNKELLVQGEMPEVDYIENNLWLCFEAMVKLMSALIQSKIKAPEFQVLVEGVSNYAFEYARMIIYTRHRDEVARYLEEQGRLDAALQAMYDDYINELQIQADRFMTLIEDAFSPDFSTALRGSVELARIAGVKEEEILVTTADIDEFFM